MGETIAAGGLEFYIENRMAGDDGGPSIQVLARIDDGLIQLLRFDMFYKQPHYHYAPNGQNIRYDLDRLTVDDGIGWVMALFGRKLPELLAKAGYDRPLTLEQRDAVNAALPRIDARWRAQEVSVPA